MPPIDFHAAGLSRPAPCTHAPSSGGRRVLFVLKCREAPYADADGDGGWGGETGGQALSSGLFNSARFVAELLAGEGVPTRLVHVGDGNDVHREIVAFGATDVVIEAFWCPPYKFDDLYHACPDVRFVVRNHSETPFLASEGMAFEWIFDYLGKPNVVVAPNSPRMLADTRALAAAAHPGWLEAEIARRVPCLPNFYPTEAKPFPRKLDDCCLDVGCFGAVRPLKNPVTQALGALMLAGRLGKPLRFHINGGRVETGGAPILKNLDAIFANAKHAELVSHDWLPHNAFRALVAQMDLVSQVAFSETFNIVSADAASQGVPLVTSSEVPWSDDASRADPTDAGSIAHVMQAALRRGGDTADLAGLRAYCASARRAWLSYFGLRAA